MFGSFAGVFISSSLGVKFLAWMFVVMIGAALVAPFALVAFSERAKCPRCRSPMKPRYVKRSRGPDRDLFIVCDHCKVYADAHVSGD